TAKIFPQINPSDNTKIKVKYISGIEIEIPQWYLHHQGHDLETHLKTVFPQLNKYNKDGELKKEMINKIIDDIPELIPTDILELFRDIQTH
ncbi:hypothetical protein JYU20_04970, partial [Bacteroidales bacterium AH-315-I05]|nr:hypothetical protein [Bacteroidales bacterium AH-315-I05]